jgi:hypothetical protein
MNFLHKQALYKSLPVWEAFVYCSSIYAIKVALPDWPAALHYVGANPEEPGCFRTFKGAEHYARIAGFISTTRKHKLNVFKELCNVFEGYSFLTIEQLAK